MSNHHDIDVLIIGFGAAGANAAIAAHDAGARVLIMEKLGVGGGNSAVSAGSMIIPQSLEEAIKYYRALSFNTVNEEMVQSFAQAMMGIPDLLAQLGIEFSEEALISPSFPSLMQCKLRPIHIKPTGVGGFHILQNLVKDRDIEVLTSTSVTRLIQCPDTQEILGAMAKQGGEDIQILAHKAVILTCGGYGSNPKMLDNFNTPGATDYIFSWGSTGNTGDGIQLASEVGAALWHMAAIEWGKFCARVPSKKFGVAIGYGLGRTKRSGSYIFVNKYGERFMAEDISLSHRKDQHEFLQFNHQKAEYSHLPAFMIFDQTYKNCGPITATSQMFMKKRGGCVGYPVVHNLYDWSADNQAEIDQGWVIEAETITELASKTGIDANGLQNTIHQYNHVCKTDGDTAFGRRKTALLPLETPPYFAVELGLAIVNTQGGPKRNQTCQVLDYNNRAIPRLYAAGELGSFFGFLYQIGSNYPEAWAFGQIAGKMAASEAPRAK